MKTCFSFLLLISTFILANGQVIVFEEGDSIYQIGTKLGSNDIITWKFKENLPKGKYWAVWKSECGVDTLAYAEFIADGVKHGKWFENETRFCGGWTDEETGEVSGWFFSDALRWSETVYDSGFIKSRSWMFHDSGKPSNKLLYPVGATKSNEWNQEYLLYENGQVSVSRVNQPDGSQIEKSFYENGELSSKGLNYVPNAIKYPVTFFYQGGKIKAKGYYQRYLKDGIKTWVLTQSNKWLYWDNKGKLLAKAWFKNGEIIKSKVQKRSGKSIEEINAFVYQ